MAKPKTYEEALEQVETNKESLKEAKNELREFMIENKIKKDKAPEDPKLAAKFTKLSEKVDALREKSEELKEAIKELKPHKERETKYEYPEGMTDKEKKKFRAKQRREKNKPVKEEKPAPEKGGDATSAKKPLKKKTETED